MTAETANKTLKVGVPLYPTFDSLDVLGPYLVFTYAPNLELHLVAETKAAVTSLEKVQILPCTTFAACPQLDVLLVPGAADLVSPLKAGPRGNNSFLDFLVNQAQSAQLICSVCTGVLMLAAAGLLDGYTVTTHWAWKSLLSLFPCKVAPGFPRYVHSGNRVTGGGIASGIDEALYLVSLLRGQKAAMECQLKMQYRPEPLTHAGDPADGDIWKHPDLPGKVERDWDVQSARKAYAAWLTNQS